ncbi:HAMP domain-containing histidine kinase [Paenibacillus oenotherae]|uniref:histidine kinase n=1 Tax=Paenibacillus oenotherae TaxID=1435645 RepID=A0ABS7DBX3_9BACL|nr:HAMP domain-containing sensor histidine kinase [Paenibacillus oenotherae]MBW7477438.1 HAMP domain-containing histidine kinase [Paenibacillus oenotherae]
MKRLHRPATDWLNRHSLRFQLLARSLLILAALLILIGTLQYVFMKNFLYRNEAETLSAEARGPLREAMFMDRSGFGFERSNNGSGNSASDANKPRGPVLFLEDTSFALIEQDGRFTDISGTNNGSLSPRLSDAEYMSVLTKKALYKSSKEYRVVSDAEGTEQLIVFRQAGGPGNITGIIQIGKPTAPIKAVVLQQLLIFAALSVGALAGGLALYLPVLRRTLNPLQQMVKTVERTDAGNLDERFPVGQGQEEIDLLAESFNGMLGRLAMSFETEREAKEQMRRFIADASHELRTPLTSIHGFLEVLLRGAADKREQLYAALNSMHGESTRIKKLVEDLLILAKLDRAPALVLHITHLDEIISEMEPHLRMLAGNRALRVDLATGLHGMYDSDKIKQVILNLFHNAVQHTDPEQGIISVKLSTDGGSSGFIAITDNGPGITEAHMPHLFERFYRSDSSRTRKHGGAGLGLAISKSIAEAHGGRIEVASKVKSGSTFTLQLPLMLKES